LNFSWSFRAGGHYQLAEELETNLSDPPPSAGLNSAEWTHPRANREEAVASLVLSGQGDGSFLIRK